jgi:hypothetical protein
MKTSMSKVERISTEFVDFIPATLMPGVLYVSRKYRTASHLCCCGCGSKVVTPLKPGRWVISSERELVTLHPSIGSWNLPCQSHYFIRGGRVVWAPRWSREEIEEARRRDRADREAHFDPHPHRQPPGRAFIEWLWKIFGPH